MPRRCHRRPGPNATGKMLTSLLRVSPKRAGRPTNSTDCRRTWRVDNLQEGLPVREFLPISNRPLATSSAPLRGLNHLLRVPMYSLLAAAYSGAVLLLSLAIPRLSTPRPMSVMLSMVMAGSPRPGLQRGAPTLSRTPGAVICISGGGRQKSSLNLQGRSLQVAPVGILRSDVAGASRSVSRPTSISVEQESAGQFGSAQGEHRIDE